MGRFNDPSSAAVPVQVTPAEIAAGTETALRSTSPADIVAFIAAHGGAGLSRVPKLITFADSPYTMAAAPGTDDTLYVDSSGGAVVVNLPAASGFTPVNTREIKRFGTNLVTLNKAGSDTIDGQASYTLNTQNESVTLESNGVSRWNAF